MRSTIKTIIISCLISMTIISAFAIFCQRVRFDACPISNDIMKRHDFGAVKVKVYSNKLVAIRICSLCGHNEEDTKYRLWGIRFLINEMNVPKNKAVMVYVKLTNIQDPIVYTKLELKAKIDIILKDIKNTRLNRKFGH